MPPAFAHHALLRPASSTRRLVCLALSGAVALSCRDKASTEPPKTAPTTASGSDVERFFPLEDGRIYHYVTRENGESGMLIGRVHRTSPTHGELHVGGSTKRFVYAPAGVAYDGGAVILPSPVVVGSAWPGEHGGTAKITEVGVDVTVAAGTFSGCARTVEEGGRVPGATYRTTYCPGTGMVLLEVSAPGAEARAELKSYGAPVQL